MNFENKKMQLCRLVQDSTSNDTEKKTDVMEYHRINGIDFGFVECRDKREFYAIHLDSGFAAVTMESKGYGQKQGFIELYEKVKAIPEAQFKDAIPKMKKRFKDFGLTYPLNG